MERDRMLAHAEQYQLSFKHDDLTASPTRKIAVLTCMDARLDLFRLLGLQIGDAHIIRNAGGRATDDALRSLILSTNSLGTREIAVIHHTVCGLHGRTNEAIADQVAEVSGNRPDIEFHAFVDLVASVTEDIECIRLSPFLPSDAEVWGAIYDVGDGSLHLIGGGAKGARSTNERTGTDSAA
jgi:carbonic anhydrase